MTFNEITSRLENYRYDEKELDEKKKRLRIRVGEDIITISGDGASSFHGIAIVRESKYGVMQNFLFANLETIKSFGVGYDVLYFTFYDGVQIEVPIKLVPIRG